MTPEQIGDLLGVCTSYDNRNVDDAAVYAWYRALGDLPYADCEAAVFEHYAKSSEWIMPAHVRRIARREIDRQAEHDRLRTLLDPIAYRKSIARTDAEFARKLLERTGKKLKAIDD